MRRWQRAMLVAAGLGVLASSAGTAGPVAITAPGLEGGKGFAFRQGNQCIVITAAHVVAGSAEPFTMAGTGFTTTVPAGDWITESALDIARVTLPLAGLPSCTEPLHDPAWLRTARFTTNSQFTMPVRTAQGSTEVLRLRWSASQGGQFRFAPERGQRGIARGDSGSVIFLNDRPAGVLLRRDTASPSVEAIRMDVLWSIWRDALQTEAPRVGVLLSGVSESGRPSQRMISHIYEIIQRHPSLALSNGQDPRACKIAIDIAAFETKQVDNPAHTRWRGATCGSGMGLGDIACRALRGVEPPRYIAQHAINYGFVGQTAAGSVRVSNPAFQLSTQAIQATRDQIMLQFVQVTLPTAVDQALREGVCG